MSLWLLFTPAGCGTATESASGDEAIPSLQPIPGKTDKVVAKVNGTPILSSDLEVQLKGGGTPREALQQLIQLEVLAQEAQRRGLARNKQALKVRRKAMAQQALEQGFNKEYGPQSIPMHMVEKAYKRYRRRYNHAELVKITHALIRIKDDKDNKATPAKLKAALRVAKEMHAAVAGKGLSNDDFVARTREVVAKYPEQVFHSETLTTDLHGRNAIEFTKAAFALKDEGQVSEVLKTPNYGYHVLRMIKRIPARKDGLRKVEQEIRAGIAPATKTAVYSRWIDMLSQLYKVKVDMDVLTAALAKGTKDPTRDPAR